MINKDILIWALIGTSAILAAVGGTIIHSRGDLLPPIGKWTNCGNLPEVCDFPEMEIHNLSDIAVYRFENGSMIGQYIGDSPLDVQ